MRKLNDCVRGIALAAIACVAQLELVGCDECAGMDQTAMASCCTQHSDSPSCVTVPDVEECASDNDEPSGACALSVGAETIGRLADGADRDVFSFVAAEDAANAVVSFEASAMLEDGMSAAAVDVAVTNEAGEIVAAFFASVGAEPIVRTFGVSPGAVYFIRVASVTASTDGPLDYDIALDFGSDAFEREPNAEVATASPIADGSIRGSSAASGVDVDYFRVSPPSDAMRMTVSLALNDGASQVELEGAVLDARETNVGMFVATSEEPGVLTLGVSDAMEYWIRLGGRDVDSEVDYTLDVVFDDAATELEPNDSVPNAQEVVVGTELVGGYSQVAPLVDDDLFRVTGTGPGTTLNVTLDRGDAGGTEAISLALLGGEETVLESIDVGPGDSGTLNTPVSDGQEVVVRVRLEHGVQGETYALSIAEER